MGNISGVKREFESLGFCLKKHYCPYCNEKLIRTKTETIVNSESEEASNYDFSNADGFMTENIKFVRTVYLCKKCGREYTEKEVKENDLKSESQKKKS